LWGETIIVEGDPGNVASAALGIELGNFARSVVDYKELRDSQKAKIAELEQKVANEADPGEKAELQRDLDYWKRIDKWSSEMEGTALRAMGIYNIPDFYALGTAVIQGLNNLDQYERQQAAKQRLDFATSVRQRFERSVRKQPGDDKLLAYSPVELLTMSEIDRELFFKAVQDPKVKAQIEADWKSNRLISNDPLNVAFAVSDPLTNMAIRADMGEEDQRAQNAVAEIEALRQEIAKMEQDITGPGIEVQHLKEKYSAFQQASLKFMYKKETMTKAELDELDKMRSEIGEIQARLGQISGPYYQALNAIGDKKSKIESLQATIRIRRERKEYAGLNIWLINGYSPSISYQEKQRWLAELNQEQNLKPQAQQFLSPLQVSREPASSNPTPTPAPTSAPTPYPGAGGLWKEREQAVRQEYDAAWAAVPEAKRLQLHDDEASFQDTIKAFDPPTRIRTLKQRIELLKSFAPRPVRKL
jgi:predicted  nucleic acid-binding Zn-ribbon protein